MGCRVFMTWFMWIHISHLLVSVCRHDTKFEFWLEYAHRMRGLCVCAEHGMGLPICLQILDECCPRIPSGGTPMTLGKFVFLVYYVEFSSLVHPRWWVISWWLSIFSAWPGTFLQLSNQCTWGASPCVGGRVVGVCLFPREQSLGCLQARCGSFRWGIPVW